ncbi:CLIP domain-containing serine protease B9 isoform X2 [Eurosta solidaginis]|uniref:CLIP domain-containing serine protease B9 isoform X2 n=1 Tax=Eurosta solidaginis TaxID=178769 RepID=UPI003531727C
MQRWICLIILLSFHKTSIGISLPTNLPTCNCIPLKECHSIAHLLLNHETHEAEMIYKIVQNAGCGYIALDPLVCCPTTYVNHKTAMYSDESDASISTRAHPDIWVWDSEQLQTRFHKSTKLPMSASSTLTRSNKSKSNVFYEEKDIIDFKDPLTKGNWPHSFYEEPFEYHNNDIYNDQSQHDCDTKQKDDDKNGHHKSSAPQSHHIHHFDHRKFYPHNHYNMHNHDISSDDESDFMEEDYIPHTSFRPIKNDGIFVYPDDERLKRPLYLPTASTSKPTKIITIIMKSTEPTTTISSATAAKEAFTPTKQSNINSARCGLPELDVTTGERIYPWISRIAHINKTNNVISYRCAGSVVSESHILTAAHCVTNLVKDLQLSHIRIGGLALSPNCTVNSNANFSVAARSYQIAQVYVHPNYDQPPYANDIALVKINVEAIGYTPICLPPNVSNSVWDQLIGISAIALGWTANFGGNDSAVKPTVRYLSLPIVNTTECAITYAEFNNPIVITPSQLCAQGGPMNDVCQGDSGGPLMDDGTSGLINSDGRHSLLGIVAFGPTKCGMSNIPGVYTRVSSYLEWIMDTIKLK